MTSGPATPCSKTSGSAHRPDSGATQPTDNFSLRSGLPLGRGGVRDLDLLRLPLLPPRHANLQNPFLEDRLDVLSVRIKGQLEPSLELVFKPSPQPERLPDLPRL